MTSINWILGSLMSSSFVIKCNCSIGFFLMMVWSLFIIDLMGLFFYNKNGSIISIGDLPTTNIIEPIFLDDRSFRHHHFRALIAVKTALSKKNSSRHISRFEVRNLRIFLKVIFLHLTSAIRERWGVVVQFSDNFLMCTPY